MDHSSLLSEFHRSLPPSPSHPPPATVNPALLRRMDSPGSSPSPSSFSSSSSLRTTDVVVVGSTGSNISRAGSPAVPVDGRPPTADAHSVAAGGHHRPGPLLEEDVNEGVDDGSLPPEALPSSNYLLQSPFDFNPLGSGASEPASPAASTHATVPLGSSILPHYHGPDVGIAAYPCSTAAAITSHHAHRGSPLARQLVHSASPEPGGGGGGAGGGARYERGEVSAGPRRFSLSEFLAPVHDPAVDAAMTHLADSKASPAVFLDLLHAPLTISEMSNPEALMMGQPHPSSMCGQGTLVTSMSPSQQAPFLSTNASISLASSAQSPKLSAVAEPPSASPGGGPAKKKKKRLTVPKATSNDPNSAAVKNFPCDVPGCHKTFKRAEHLKRHVMSVHTAEKPFRCPMPSCDKEFSRPDNLNQHIRTHKQRDEKEKEIERDKKSKAAKKQPKQAKPQSAPQQQPAQQQHAQQVVQQQQTAEQEQQQQLPHEDQQSLQFPQGYQSQQAIQQFAFPSSNRGQSPFPVPGSSGYIVYQNFMA